MKDKIRKLDLRFISDDKETEIKLEKMAAKGLFLEKVDTYFWTYRKSEPKVLKYAITYFSNGSIFNYEPSENQKNYYDYGKESGWVLVCENNQMQIFSSEDLDAIPFETDEATKFENLKKCMRKNFLPTQIITIIIYGLCLWTQYGSFEHSYIKFLSSNNNLYLICVLLPIFLLSTYNIANYFLWCKKAKKAIEMGNECIEKASVKQKYFGYFYLIYTGILTVLMFYNILVEYNILFLLLILLHVPLLTIGFSKCIKFMKKRKATAKKNALVSIIFLFVLSFGYLFFVLYLVINFDFDMMHGREYRSKYITYSNDQPREYKIYNDDIPLLCQDLYGAIDYDDYSYELDVDESIFIKVEQYTQDTYPMKNSPAEISYEIYTPKMDFIYDLCVKELTFIDEYRNVKLREVDGFNANVAYGFYYDDNTETKRFLLLYDDRIISLQLDSNLEDFQVKIIVDKLDLK